MKKDLNRFLLFAALFFLGLSVVAFWVDIRGLLFLPGCALFCFQLLACQMTNGWGGRLAPLAALLLWAGCGLLIAVYEPGWDGLLGVIMLYASIAPAVGIVLAWIVHGITRRSAKKDTD